MDINVTETVSTPDENMHSGKQFEKAAAAAFVYSKAATAFDPSKCKIFLVGAGGIGCEVLKNLVMSGFRCIDIIDLDTIEVSNLNRQFLFRREHVGQPKAIVACEAAKKFTHEPAASSSIVAHHDTIFSSDYGVSFIKKFDLVINALDNLKARSHMNRLCLAANIPLIETGSRGWMGQTYLILRGQTECFDCVTKKGDRTYAGCTIRNTPSEPIHCIVWAKFLFNQLFGEHDPDQDVSPDDADPELVGSAAVGSDVATDTANASVHVNGVTGRVTARQLAEKCNYDFPVLFNKFFNTDIVTLCSMSKLWAPGRGRRQPQPLQYGELSNITDASRLLNAPASSSASAAAHEYRERNVALDDERLWSPRECADMFKLALKSLLDRIHVIKAEKLKEAGRSGVVLHPSADGGGLPLLVWDKDDNEAMDFLAAAANLRMLSFHIPMQTRFRIKSMAGLIVPAVAATNAIVAALAMRHVWQILKEHAPVQSTAYLNTQRDYMGHKRILGAQHSKPNPNCLICSMATGQRQLSLKLNPQLCTVAVLEDEVLKKELRFAAPDCQLTERGAVLISSEPGELDAIRHRTLASMGVSDGSLLIVDDFLQEMKIQIVILADSTITDANVFYVIREGEVAAVVVEPPGGAKEEQEEISEQTAPSPKKFKTASCEAENVIMTSVSGNRLTVPTGRAAAEPKIASPLLAKRKIDEVLAAKMSAKATTTMNANSVGGRSMAKQHDDLNTLNGGNEEEAADSHVVAGVYASRIPAVRFKQNL